MSYEESYAAAQARHSVMMEGRERLSVSGVTDVESFNEQEVAMDTSKGLLIVRGDELHMEKLSVDSGDVIITGKVDALEYEDREPAGEGFFARLFR